MMTPLGGLGGAQDTLLHVRQVCEARERWHHVPMKSRPRSQLTRTWQTGNRSLCPITNRITICDLELASRVNYNDRRCE